MGWCLPTDRISKGRGRHPLSRCTVQQEQVSGETHHLQFLFPGKLQRLSWKAFFTIPETQPLTALSCNLDKKKQKTTELILFQPKKKKKSGICHIASAVDIEY